MADPQIITTLRRKREEIEAAIEAYEQKVAHAKIDLAHVNATLALFEMDGDRSQFPVYMDIKRLFRRGEIVTICRAALAEHGPQDTRELAGHVLRAKGLDDEDKVLRRSVTFSIVQALTLHLRRDTIGSPGKRKGVRLWRALERPITTTT